MKKIFLILILFSNSILFGMFGGFGGGGGDISSASGISSFSNTVASNPGLASGLSSIDKGLSNLGNSPVIQWINNSIGAPIGALIEGVNITTGSSINNNTTNQTPAFVPTSPTPTCVTTNQSENPYYAAARCSGKTTVQCLLASAEAALSAGGLPILGVRVTGVKENGKWPVIVQTYLPASIPNNSGKYLNNSCVSGPPYSSSNSMAGLCSNSSALKPYFSYITNCLEEGKTDPAGPYGTEYNFKVFFNNANATFNGTSVNPIQCMKCTSGTISSCVVHNNNSYNPYPACATQTTAPTPTPTPNSPSNSPSWGQNTSWGHNQFGGYPFNRPQF